MKSTVIYFTIVEATFALDGNSYTEEVISYQTTGGPTKSCDMNMNKTY